MKGNKLTPGSNLRWESSRMILPEHREQWLRHQQEQKKAKKPELDPQRWEELEWILADAMRDSRSLRFTYWEDGFFYDITGTCHFINHEQQQFHIQTKGGVKYLKFEHLVHIE
ncbi:YolD-like family protein [Salibacterium halotolerans]|uniref:YolD-like protein n=1 Tax=Salibacterium halotolerans TaxID=1884432 RepID=A0A1I5VB57_9BACI|nr:YolD-like family protein [Salibacterium halotolerans]SFQ04631.1 YolD-like protein [Salibacterium halotolerans]